jgi:hypothetical protein
MVKETSSGSCDSAPVPNVTITVFTRSAQDDRGGRVIEFKSSSQGDKKQWGDSRCFIRACESGVFRSLNEVETACFLVALSDMPWSSSGWSNVKAAGGKLGPSRFR